MLLRKLEIKNYLGIQHAVIDFNVDSGDLLNETIKVDKKNFHLAHIIGSDYMESLDQINNLFDFLTTIGKPRLAEACMNKTFMDCPMNCILSIEFDYETVRYRYELKMNEDGVHKELLFADDHLKYNSRNDVRPTPRFPEGISRFFNKFVCIDLASPTMVTNLVMDSIERCGRDAEFRRNVSTLMKRLELTDKDIIAEEETKKVFINDIASDTYIDIRETKYYH